MRWIAFDEGHIAAPHDGGPGNSGIAAFSPGETWNFFNQFADSNPGTGDPGAPTVTASATAPPESSSPAGSCAGLWGQCGGQGWSGPTCCAQGTCKYINNWHSQCLQPED